MMPERGEAASLGLNVLLMKIVGLLGPDGGSARARALHDLYCAVVLAVNSVQVACNVAGMAQGGGDFDVVVTGACETLALSFTLARHVFFLCRRRDVRRLLATLRRLEDHNRGHPIVTRTSSQVYAMTLAFNALALVLFVAWMASPLVLSGGSPDGPRSHPFRATFFADQHLSPYYEAVFVLQAMSFSYCFVAVNFDVGAVALCRHAGGQFRVLLASLADLPQSGGTTREQESSFLALVHCIDRHNAIIEFVRQLDNIYTTIMLGQLVYSILQIAIAGFQFTQNSYGFEKSWKFLVAVIFLTAELYLFCSCGEDFVQLSQEVATAAYNVDWIEADPKLRDAIRLVMRAGQNPATLTAFRFKKLSMETFVAVINASYTYFALLRELKKAE